MTKPLHPHRRRHGSTVRHDLLEIVYEDRDVVVADKPAGMLSIATATERRLTAYAILFDHVRGQGGGARLFIVHRLDREASGLIVFAKSEDAKYRLQDQFKDHSAGRTYAAVTEGRIERDAFTIKSYLAENAAFRCYTTPDARKGKLAITHVNTLARTQHRSLIEVRLETGRKHQIRVHLADEGHRIVGDPVYGKGNDPIRRLALHGVRLAFKHPHSGKRMAFESPIPPEFLSLVPLAPRPAVLAKGGTSAKVRSGKT